MTTPSFAEFQLKSPTRSQHNRNYTDNDNNYIDNDNYNDHKLQLHPLPDSSQNPRRDLNTVTNYTNNDKDNNYIDNDTYNDHQ
jgi:hypothetical protein